jgi:hypothetical protein
MTIPMITTPIDRSRTRRAGAPLKAGCPPLPECMQTRQQNVGGLPTPPPKTTSDLVGWGRFELPTSASRNLSERTSAVPNGRDRRSLPHRERRRPTAVRLCRGADAGCHLESWAGRSVRVPGLRQADVGPEGPVRRSGARDLASYPWIQRRQRSTAARYCAPLDLSPVVVLPRSHPAQSGTRLRTNPPGQPSPCVQPALGDGEGPCFGRGLSLNAEVCAGSSLHDNVELTH